MSTKRLTFALSALAAVAVTFACAGNEPSDRTDRALVVEAACGECQFGMAGTGCDLAVRIDGKAYLVQGTGIDEHGDAHADDGFCNAIRSARVTGRVEGDVFVAESFELVSADD